MIEFRRATPEDTPACFEVRGRTRENAITEAQLGGFGITRASWSEGVRLGVLVGHVCIDGGTVTGFCAGHRDSGEVLVLALLPGHEKQGAGRQLLALVMADLASVGHARLFLSSPADPATRAHGFYRHLGWRPTGEVDGNGDVLLEYLLPR